MRHYYWNRQPPWIKHTDELKRQQQDSNQATTDIIESDPTAKETISEPSEYEVMRTNAIAKKNRATQTRLEKVLSYTKQTMVVYMSEEDLNLYRRYLLYGIAWTIFYDVCT